MRVVMHVLFSCGVLCCVSGALSAASQPQPLQTGPMRTAGVAGRFDYEWCNGTFWSTQLATPQAKNYFIIGLGEGIMLESRQICDGTDDLAFERIIEQQTLSVIGSSYSLAQIISGIDAFYTSGSLASIPIIEAYQYVLEQLRGSGKDVLRARMDALKKRYAKEQRAVPRPDMKP